MKSLTTRVFNRVYRSYRKVKYKLRDTAWMAGMNRSFFQDARGARILVYHGICEEDHLRFNTLFLTEKTFAAHLLFFKEYFNVISLDDYYEGRFSEERFNICISFDDGFANNLKYVLPLLERFKVPATFFITSVRASGSDILWNDVMSIAYKYGPDKIKFREEVFIKRRARDYVSSHTGQRFVDSLRSTEMNEKTEMMNILGPLKENVNKDYWLQMTPEQIRELSQSEWATIGSHSYFHHDLAKLSIPALRIDLADSRWFLEKIIGKPVNAIAFPYGSYNQNVVDESKRAGYMQLLATEFLLANSKNDPVMRERLTVNPFISVVNQMYAIVNGRY